MTQAQFYYRNENAPQPKGNRIGTCVLIEYDGKLLLEHRTDSDTYSDCRGVCGKKRWIISNKSSCELQKEVVY